MNSVMVTYPRYYSGGSNKVGAVGEEDVKYIIPSRGCVNCLAEACVIECVQEGFINFFKVLITFGCV